MSQIHLHAQTMIKTSCLQMRTLKRPLTTLALTQTSCSHN